MSTLGLQRQLAPASGALLLGENPRSPWRALGVVVGRFRPEPLVVLSKHLLQKLLRQSQGKEGTD